MNEEGNRMFPRGMVLGLTMAETVLLVVFGILLLFAALFVWERDASRQQRENLEDQLAEYGVEPDLPDPEDPPTDGERWREIVAVVEEDLREERPDAILVILKLAEQWRDEGSSARRLAEALHESGVAITEDSMRDLVTVTNIVRDSGMTAAELQHAMERASVSAASDALRKTLADAGIDPTLGNLRELAAAVAAAADAEMMPGEMREAIERVEESQSARELEQALDAAGLAPTPEAMRELADLAEVSVNTGLSPRELQDRVGGTRTDRAVRDLRRALSEAGFEPNPATVRELAETAEQLANSGLSADDVRRALDDDAGRQAAVERLREALVAADLDVSPESLRRLSDLANTAAETGRTPEEILDAIRQSEGGTGGTENPSCLRNSRGRPAYLYDVALAAAGYFLEPTRAPAYTPARSTPPPRSILTGVRTGRWLSEAQFQEQTLPIRTWSDVSECVLFVRVWDQTLPREKQLYKDRMRTLESVFYRFEVSGELGPTERLVPR